MKRLARFLAAALVAAALFPATGHPAEPDAESSTPDAASIAASAALEIDAFIARMRDEHGFDDAELTRLFVDFSPNPTVLQAILPPAVRGDHSWKAYRARFLNPRRIQGGVLFWRRHEAELKRAEARYGVPPEIIVAIIGIETLYGHNTGRFNVLRSLASLAFYYPPRADYFKSELEQFLLFSRENGIDPATITGSYAGAIGIPQFMPGSIRRFAVDFEDKGHIDLRNSTADSIGSVASFLYQHGWERDDPVAVPASLQGDPEPLLALGILPQKTLAELAAEGVTTPEFIAPGDPKRYAALIDLETPGEKTEYWAGFNNFYALTRYNRSNFYAMSVYQLAQAISTAREKHPDKAPEGARPKTRAKGKKRS
ncbi:MAG: lytic murein transglycosylase B [Betaproteobacteria bacterium]|nr:lytic murein transglycosylase B [Betaproteobacteria bacterium]